MKVIIGTGDSWTQGDGAVSDEVKQMNLNFTDPRLLEYERKNSWVSVLCRDYLTDYTPIIRGCKGIGNRAAARSLYFIEPSLRKSISEGYLIFLLSGWDRFDYFNRHCNREEIFKFRSILPGFLDKEEVSKVYYEELHNDTMSIAETMCSIIEAQNFAKVHNLKFIFANAFDHRGPNEFKLFPDLYNQIEMDCFLNNYTTYFSFQDHLRQLSNTEEQYIAECFHPSIKGQEVIAKEFYKFIISKEGKT